MGEDITKTKEGKKDYLEREKEEGHLKKVQLLAQSYYARKEIQNAIFEFCKNRETIPRYMDFFGKRPDCLDYPNDIFNYAKKGATSFHCSEEIWDNPLNINTNMTPEEYNQIKIGWDFLIDIDSKYLDYSKIAAKLLINELENHGIKNIGIKFSGSKGFHIIIPFGAFPKEFNGELTKDKFPEWPRHIANYLSLRIRDKLNREVFKITNPEELEKKGLEVRTNLCSRCGKPTIKKTIGIYKCPNFKCRTEVKSTKSNRKEMICPSCNDKMKRIDEEEIFYCEGCKTNSAILNSSIDKFGDDEFNYEQKKKDIEFKENLSADALIEDVDIVLVASRHLFRAPYSLHEKTSLSSVVLSKEDLDDFKPIDAEPLKIKEPKRFMPDFIEGEAKELLFQALDNLKKDEEKTKKFEGKSVDLKGLVIGEEMFPPIIKRLMDGIKGDGRKRALYILLSFFSFLEFPEEYISEKIEGWNKKNKVPLKQGYVKSQVEWFIKRKPLPPNYDKPIYKEFGALSPLEIGIKNPINYTIKMAMSSKGKKEKNRK